MNTDEIVIDVSKNSSKLLWIGGVLVIGGLLAFGVVSMHWPVPTGISLEVPVSRAEWTVGLFPSQQILNPLRVESISFQNFSIVEFNPSVLQVADPDQYDGMTKQFSRSAWIPVTVFGDVRLSPKNQESLIRIQPKDQGKETLGTLSSIQVREESNVILEVAPNDPRTVTIKILGPESGVQFIPAQPFEIIADETNFAGLKEFPFINKSSLTFRPELPEHHSYIEIKGTKQQLVITLTVSPSQDPTVFSEKAIPIKAIDFSRKNGSRQTMSTLVGPGKLEYRDYSNLSAKTISATDLVHIEPRKILTIRRITLLPQKPGLVFFLDGTAKSIQTGSDGSFIDHRVSLADKLLKRVSLTVQGGKGKAK